MVDVDEASSRECPVDPYLAVADPQQIVMAILGLGTLLFAVLAQYSSSVFPRLTAFEPSDMLQYAVAAIGLLLAVVYYGSSVADFAAEKLEQPKGRGLAIQCGLWPFTVGVVTVVAVTFIFKQAFSSLSMARSLALMNGNWTVNTIRVDLLGMTPVSDGAPSLAFAIAFVSVACVAMGEVAIWQNRHCRGPEKTRDDRPKAGPPASSLLRRLLLSGVTLAMLFLLIGRVTSASHSVRDLALSIPAALISLLVLNLFVGIRRGADGAMYRTTAALVTLMCVSVLPFCNEPVLLLAVWLSVIGLCSVAVLWFERREMWTD